MNDLFVDDWMRRRGVGALIDDAMRGDRTGRGRRRVEVSGNRHALAFYTKVGFHADAEVAVEFRDGAPHASTCLCST